MVTPTDEPTTPAARPRRARRWAILLGVAGLLGLWGALAAFQLLGARADASGALDDLQAFRRTANADTLLGGEGVDELRAASRRFRDAEARTESLLVSPLRVLPVVGRQVRSVDALTGAAADLTDEAARALDRLDSLTTDLGTDPSSRSALLRGAAEAVDELRLAVEAADLGPDEALLGPLARLRDEAAAEIAQLDGTLTEAALGLSAAEVLLTRPGRHLVLAANNAEMRAGMGMFLQIGVLTVDGDGRFQLEEMQAVAGFDPQPTIDVDPTYAALWGWATPENELRNLGMSPRFDVTGPMAARFWREVAGVDVDSVLAVDIVAVDLLVAATGPLPLPTTTLTGGGDVVEELARGQYLRGTPQQERREQLGEAATAVVASLSLGGWDVGAVGDALRRAVAGRHLLIWSADPDQQAAWEAIGAAGTLDEDDLLLAVLNTSANKLDPYLDVRARLTSGPVDEGRREVRLAVSIENAAPAGLSNYAAGPFPGSDFANAEYGGVLAISFPGAVESARAVGDPKMTTRGPDGETVVLAVDVRVLRGDTWTQEFVFTVPEALGSLELRPGARVPATTFRVGDDRVTDATGHRIGLSDLPMG